MTLNFTLILKKLTSNTNDDWMRAIKHGNMNINKDEFDTDNILLNRIVSQSTFLIYDDFLMAS